MPDTAAIALDALNVSDPSLYQNDEWHEPFARLRRDDPVHFVRTAITARSGH